MAKSFVPRLTTTTSGDGAAAKSHAGSACSGSTRSQSSVTSPIVLPDHAVTASSAPSSRAAITPKDRKPSSVRGENRHVAVGPTLP